MSQFNNLLLASAAAGGPESLYDIISGLGLTTNLKLCLDAGDSASYDPAVQTAKWLDTSGNGCDWCRGTSAVGDAGEPTFNGSAGGLSNAEYWSTTDSNQKFDYDAAPETWMVDLAKAGATWTMMCVWKPQLSTGFRAIFNFGFGTGAGNRGLAVVQTSTETIEVRTHSATANNAELSISAASQNIGGWNVLLISWDEPGNYNWRNNANTGSGDGSYLYTTAGLTNTPVLFGNLPGGPDIACAAIWTSALTSTNLTDIYDAIKGRFGL